MVESELVKEWERQGRLGTLVRVLTRKFGEVPKDMADTLRASTDGEQLYQWFETAALVDTFAEFRRETGL